MLLCFLSSAFVLLGASVDQTGGTFANVSEAFAATLNPISGIIGGSADQSRTTTNVWPTDPAPPSQTPQQGNPGRRFRDDEWAELDNGDFVTSPDNNADVFANFVSELSRFVPATAVISYAGEITIDFLSPGVEREDRIRDLILHTVQLAQHESETLPLNFELILWANTPRPASLADAASDAAELKNTLENQLSSQGGGSTRISSSGRVWTSRTKLRPVVTIVVRCPKR